MQQVNFDNIGLVEFPDDWSEDQIRSHLTTNKDAIRKELIASRATMADQEAIDEAPEATLMEKVGSGAGAALQGASRTFSGTPKALAEFGEFMNRNVADLSFGQERDPKKRPLYRLGEGIENIAEEAAPVDPTLANSFLFTDVPGAIGNMGAMLATGGIAGLAGKATAMAASIGMGMAGEFEDTFEREMGRQQSAEETPDPDKAFAKSLGYSTIAGAIESKFGAGRLIRKYQKLFGSKTAEQVAKELAEKGVNPNYISSFLGGVAKDTAAGMGEEAAQRAVQDLIVDGKLSPDAILREGGAGGIAQALLGLPGSHFNAKRNGRTAPITQQVVEETEGLQPLTADTVAAMEKEFVIDPKTPFVDLQPGVTKQNETQSNPAPVIPTPVSEVVPAVPALQTTDGALPIESAQGTPPAIVPEIKSSAPTETTSPVPKASPADVVEPAPAEVPAQPIAAVEPEQITTPATLIPETIPQNPETIAPVSKNSPVFPETNAALPATETTIPSTPVNADFVHPETGETFKLNNGVYESSKGAQRNLAPDEVEGFVKGGFLKPVVAENATTPLKPGDRVTWKTAKGKQLSGTISEIGKNSVRIDTDGKKGNSVVSPNILIRENTEQIKAKKTIEERLDSWKVDMGGKVFDVTGASIAVIRNLAIDFAKLAIRTGRTVKEAVQDTVAWLKSKELKFDEAEMTGELEKELTKPDAATITTEPHSDRKKTTAFAIPENEINYFTQTEKGRTELADKWIENHGGDLEAARLGVLRSDAKMLGINDSLKIVFLTQIEIKAIEKWTTEKNPVDKMRWLELARAADQDAQKAVSDAGQGLQASQQRYREAVASGPMMDYINGILQGQQLALGNRFPEVISDNIRKWLSESADIAIAKIKKEVSEAANVADRKLKQGVEELETTFRDIMTSSVRAQGNVQQEIYRRIRTHKNLKDLTSAEALELTNLLAAAWHKVRMKVFRTEFRKAVPLPNVAEADKAKLEAAIPEIIKQANLGLFDNEAFRNAVAPRYGAKAISEETAKKIFSASQKAQDKPEGAQRNEAIRKVFDIVKREAGLTNTQLLSSWWYAAILSGSGTQVRNVLGTASNLVSNFAALSVREPKAIPAMIMGLLRGFRMNAQGEFQAIMKRGAPSSRIGTDIRDAANALELAKDEPRAWARLLSNGKYVSRFMIATDSFFYDGAVEARAVFDAFRDGKEQGLTRAQLQNYIFDTLKLSESERITAIAQARSEITGGLTNPKDLQRRTNEILRQRRPDEIRASSEQFALEVTLNNKPTGFLGVIANKIIESRSQFPLLTPLFPFVRISANAGNVWLNHSPIGLARLIYARPGAKLAFGGKFDYRLTVDQWQQLRAQVILSHSMAIGLAVMAIAEADEDDPLLEISGSFRNIPPAKRRQLEEAGHRAYSIKIAGKSFEYKVTPIAALLAMVGNYLDGVKYGELEEKDLSIQAATAFGGGYAVILDQNYLSALGMFLGGGSQIGKDANTTPLVRLLARTTGGVIPTMAKDIDTWINPEVQKSVEAWDYFHQEVPVLRWAIDRPMLNALGEPIERARYPWTALFSSEKDDPIWQALSEKARAGVFLPVAAASAKVLHNGMREKMTDEEFWRYQKAVGTAYKKYFQTGNNLQNFRAMTPAQAEQLFETTFSKLRTSEREKLR